MEQQVNNVINFGIGCVRALSESYAGISARIRTGVDDLISDGEKSKDGAALRMREMANKATGFIRRGDKTQKTTPRRLSTI